MIGFWTVIGLWGGCETADDFKVMKVTKHNIALSIRAFIKLEFKFLYTFFLTKILLINNTSRREQNLKEKNYGLKNLHEIIIKIFAW